VFGSLNVVGYVPSAADLALSETMHRYWVSFAATGDPNGNGAPAGAPRAATSPRRRCSSGGGPHAEAWSIRLDAAHHRCFFATPATPRSEAVRARAIRDGRKWGPAGPATTSRGALAEPRAVPATGGRGRHGAAEPTRGTARSNGARRGRRECVMVDRIARQVGGGRAVSRGVRATGCRTRRGGPRATIDEQRNAAGVLWRRASHDAKTIP